MAATLFCHGIVKRRLGDAIGADVDIAAAIGIESDVAALYAKYCLSL